MGGRIRECGLRGDGPRATVCKTTIFRSFRAQKYNILPGLRQSAALQRSNRGRLGGRGHGNSMKSEVWMFRIHATVPRFSRVLRKNYMGLGYVLQATGFRLQGYMIQ